MKKTLQNSKAKYCLSDKTNFWRQLFILLPLLIISICSSAQTISGSNYACKNQEESYNVSGITSPSWQVTGGVIVSGASSSTVTIKWAQVGTGILTAIGSNSQVSLSVQVNNIPSPSLSILPDASCTFGKLSQSGIGNTGVLSLDRVDEAISIGLVLACLTSCEYNTNTYLVGNNIGSTYNWTVTGAQSYSAANNILTVIWGAKGAGIITLTETNASGCSTTLTQCVDIQEAPKALFTALPEPVNNTITLCRNQEAFFLDQSIGGTNWNWDFGDGSTSSSQNPNHSYGQAGTYIVTLTVGNGNQALYGYGDVKAIFATDYDIRVKVPNDYPCNCTATYSMTVIVSPDRGPKIECISTICGNTTQTYSTPADCDNYTWQAMGGNIVSANGNSVTVNWGDGTTIPSYLSLDIGNCSGYCSEPTIAVIPIIPPTATVTGAIEVCAGTFESYSVPQIGGLTYDWQVSGGFIVSGENTNQIRIYWPSEIAPGGPYIIKVYYFNEVVGCAGNAELNVKVLPELGIEHTGVATICEGEQNTANVQITLNDLNNDLPVLANWTVTGPGGQIHTNAVTNSADFSAYTYVDGPGTYIITATPVSSGYCNTSATAIVEVLPKPVTPSAILGNLTICPGSVYTYTAASNETGLFNWTVTGGSIQSNSGNTVSVLWDATGPYELSVFVKAGICNSGSITQSVQALAGITAPAISGPQTVCPQNNSTFTFAGSPIANTTYQWRVEPTSVGSVIGNNGGSSVQVAWNINSPANTTATVFLLVTDACGQSSESSLPVTIQQFEADFTVPTSICEGSMLNLSYTGPYTSLSWNINSSTQVQNQANYSYEVNDPTIQSITLTVTNASGCTDQVSKSVNVLQQPAVSILSSPEVCAGSSITYDASPGQAGTYTWTPVGGSVQSQDDTEGTAIIIWGATEPYALTMQYTNAAGCASETTAAIVAGVPLFQAPVIQGPTSSCVGVVTTYSYVGDPQQGATYKWSVSPAELGTIQSSPNANNAQILWSEDAPVGSVATVNLEVVNSCGQSTSSSIQVNLEVFEVDFNLPPVCVGSSFTLTYPNPYNSIEWSVGGTGSTNASISHEFDTPGTYQVTLYVVNSGNCEASKTKQLTVNGLPTAKITTTDKIAYCVEETISSVLQGLNTSGETYQYQWFLNNSAIAPGNPYTATQVGTYYAVVTNEFGCSATSQNISITQGSCKTSCEIESGSADFTSQLVNGSCNEVTFTSYLSSNYVIAGWSYISATGVTGGAPAISNPTITFPEAGYYTVSMSYRGLYVGTDPNYQDDSISCNVTHQVFLPIVANFKTESTCIDNVFTTQLTDLSGYFSGGGIDTYTWSVDGNPFSNAPNPQLVSTPGSHTIQLVVTSSAYGLTCAATQSIVVPVAPSAAFTMSASSCLRTLVQFTDQSVPADIASWAWTFGPGVLPSAIQNPARIFSVIGANPVTLTITDEYGCTSQATQFHEVEAPGNGLIRVNQNPNLCPGQSITLYAPSGSAFIWSDGSTADEITVTQGGAYTVLVTENNGCTYLTAPYTVNVLNVAPLQANFTHTVTCTPAGAVLSLADASGLYECGTVDSYEWKINGVVVSTTDSHSTVIPSGTYTLEYTVGVTSAGIQDVVVRQITVNGGAPVAAMSYSSTVCQGSSVTFTDASTGSDIISRTWVIGSVEYTYEGLSASRVFNQAGVYPVTLTVANAYGCSVEITEMITVLEIENGSIIASALTICEGEAATLTAPSGSSYLWSNGEQTQSIDVSDAGVYSVALDGTNGCAYTASGITINVNVPQLLAISGNSNYCSNESIFLSASAGFGSYDWEYDLFPYDNIMDGSFSGINLNVNLLPGTYKVYLRAMDFNACQSVAQPFEVTVHESPFSPTVVIAGNIDPLLCAGQNFPIEVFDPQPGETYIWSTNQIGVGIVASDAGTYSVTAISASGCSTPSRNSITISPSPDVSAFLSGCYELCASDAPLTLEGISGFINNWYMQDRNVSTLVGRGEFYNAYQSGTYYVVVSNGQCSSQSEPITINFVLPPDVQITVSQQQLCEGGTATLTANGAATYVWYQNGGEVGTGNTLTIDAVNGDYISVIGTDNGLGCEGTASVYLNVTPYTATATIDCCEDEVICSGSVASIPVHFSGVGPWTFTYTDGVSQYAVTTSSNPYELQVTPSATKTYALLSVNGGEYGCTEVCGKATVAVKSCTAPIQPKKGKKLQDCSKNCFSTTVLSVVEQGNCQTVTMRVSCNNACEAALSHYSVSIPCGTISAMNNSLGFPMSATHKDPTSGLSGFKVDNIEDFCDGRTAESFDVTYTVCFGDSDCGNGDFCAPLIGYKAGTCVTFGMASNPQAYKSLDAPVETQQATRLGVYPNPFSEETNVLLELSEQAETTLGVYDLNGKLVSQLHQGSLDKGTHAFLWDGSNDTGAKLETGVYLIAVTINGKSQYHKVVLSE